MIADDIRLPPDDRQIDPDAPRVTAANANAWRFFARATMANGQVTIGADLFMDMLDQIEGLKP